MNKFHKLLEEKSILLSDGATGTNLFSKGLEAGYPPELWNLEKPEIIQNLHSEFISSGSDIILTNSFGGNSCRLKLHKLEKNVKKLNLSAARLARRVVDKLKSNTIIAGSIGPTGELFEPLGELNFKKAINIFSEQGKGLFLGGIDVFWIETMSSIDEVKAAFIALKPYNLPIICTMSFDTVGKTMMGIEPKELKKLAYELNFDGFGANCGVGPAELLDTICEFKVLKKEKIPIVAKGNCGIPEFVDGITSYRALPETMGNYTKLSISFNVKIIGGCCGTTPNHIKKMKEQLDLLPKNPRFKRDDITELLGKPWNNFSIKSKVSNKRIRLRSRHRKKI